MRVRVLKLFGREVARWESWEQATVSDVVAAMLAGRAVAVRSCDEEDEDEDEETHEVVPCTCCGEMFDPRAAEINKRFDSLVWESYRGGGDEDYSI